MAHPLTPEQLQAIDPSRSVWVSANAGTGKTKVLTSRVLRLLLEGVPPARILCLTFTNAAAAEMTLRIKESLSFWATADEAALKKELTVLLENISPRHIQRARQLFVTLVDDVQALRIQTIHAFCQSVLRRFPLEAGIASHFRLMDEKQAQELLQEAWQRICLQRDDENSPVAMLAGNLADSTLKEVVNAIIAERRKLEPLLRTHTPEAIADEAYRLLKVNKNTTETEIIDEYINKYNSELNNISKSKDKKWKKAEKLCEWLALSLAQKRRQFALLHDAFLTGKSEPRSLDKYGEAIIRVQDALLHTIDRTRALKTAQLTEAMLHLAYGLFQHYAVAKGVRAQLDYDDLISLTHDLLTQKNALPWVMFKLDGGIDHVLLDEAQDTSTEQWSIVRALCGEFFAGAGSRETPRTLFVVGDFKQSIFSVQGAAPALFHEARHYFTREAEAAGQMLKVIPLNRSYRSVPAVLEAVDAVFRNPDCAAAIGAEGDYIQHLYSRTDAPGRVELWPLIPCDTGKAKVEGWQLPVARQEKTDPAKQLANNIADAIRQWLAEKRLLLSQGRPVQPGDIMILLRKRSGLMEPLNLALAERGIPVAGVDRIALMEHIAVQDMLALSNFLLLPEDDLTLAALLKSPLIGFSEEQLFALAYGRGKASLWQQLKASEACAGAAQYLGALLNRVDYTPPLELFTHVLEVIGGRKAFVRRMGHQVNDVLDEFLSLATQYATGHTSSMQGFLHWVEAGKTEIKRDLEHGKNEVRIMTVHASKGLQAPIVFLPDSATIQQPKMPRLLWKDGLPLINSAVENRPGVCNESVNAHKTEQAEESLRLLYVAMTRAEDELYVCGCDPNKNPDKNPDKNSDNKSWYGIIKTALQGLCVQDETTGILSLSCNADNAVVPQEPAAAMSPAPPPPELFQQQAPPEAATRTLAPSSLHLPAASATDAGSAARRRGTVLHLLLQYAPDIAPEHRRQAMEVLLKKHMHTATEEEKTALITEAMAVLEHSDFAPLFVGASRPEVSVTGVVNGVTFSGQIDRLAITEREVIIVDYKTSVTPPASANDVPEAYLRQMAAYRELIRRIYPAHNIRTALVWSSAPCWMELSAELLSGYCSNDVINASTASV